MSRLGMSKLRIQFTDFWDGFDVSDNHITKALGSLCDFELSDKPDILFFSDKKTRLYRTYDCLKVYVAVENTYPNFRVCDRAFSFKQMRDPRNCRLPYYVWGSEIEQIQKDASEAEAWLARKRKFCAFIVSNGNPRRTARRIEFFNALSKYKHVDSAGKFMNNIGAPVEDKRSFLNDYKFNIAFENCISPGYVTEKVFDAMYSRCLPLYWGTRDVQQDFNTKAFVNVADFKSDAEAVEFIAALDQDDSKYLEIMRQPNFLRGQSDRYFDSSYIAAHLEPLVKTQRPSRSFFYFKDISADIIRRWHLGNP